MYQFYGKLSFLAAQNKLKHKRNTDDIGTDFTAAHTYINSKSAQSLRNNSLLPPGQIQFPGTFMKVSLNLNHI